MSALLLAGMALALASCGGTPGGVVAVSFSPTPDGLRTMVAATSPHPGLYVPLSEVSSALPPRFPPNPSQRCTVGVTVLVAFAGGRTIAYGPCNRPAGIERLRRAVIDAVERTHHLARPRGPGGWAAWRQVLDDWADSGRFDRWHSCAAVRVAIRHLPDSPPIYSSVGLDLHAYLRAVC